MRPFGGATWLVSGLLRGDEVRDAVGFDVPAGAYETKPPEPEPAQRRG